jgi:hypothetical protein
VTRRPRAWVFNLEADDERARGPGYTPSRALLARMDAMIERLSRGPLMRDGDVVLTRDDARTLGDEFDGEAWSPTARARARLARAGVRVPEAPSEAVLDAVNSREFSQRLSPVEPRERLVSRANAEMFALDEGPVRVSLAHTCSGRGHRFAEGPREARAVIDALLAKHPTVFVAERVTVLGDFALHGRISRDGRLALGEVTEQRVDPRTLAWVESAPSDALRASEREALVRATREAARELFRAGYWGPFGVDAFRYRDRAGDERFCPRGEVNARYTMGWAVGMLSRDQRTEEELLLLGEGLS